MNIGKEFILSICILVLLPVYALSASHSLIGINVKQALNGEYNIVLKLDGNTKILKTVNSPNNLALTLNSTMPVDNIEIIYDNTSDLYNVLVQKKNSDNTVVILEGQNISNSAVFISDIENGLLTPLKSEYFFFGVNNKMITYSLFAMFIWFMFILLFKTREKRHNKTINKINNLINVKAKPSISYKPQKGYVQLPKDFVINDYLQNEKIRKAG